MTSLVDPEEVPEEVKEKVEEVIESVVSSSSGGLSAPYAPNVISTSVSKNGVRTIRNACAGVRAELGTETVRCVSFFAAHPSMCPEDQWHPMHIGRDFVLIDTFTRRLMSECECHFLVTEDSADEPEPTIAAVELRPLKISERHKNTTENEDGDAVVEVGLSESLSKLRIKIPGKSSLSEDKNESDTALSTDKKQSDASPSKSKN